MHCVSICVQASEVGGGEHSVRRLHCLFEQLALSIEGRHCSAM
jgi:hypothetical protein